MSDSTTQELNPSTSQPVERQQVWFFSHSAIRYRYSLALLGLAIVYLVLAFFFSQVTPFNKGPDEGINLDYIEFIVTKGRLPVTYEERDEVGPKANWPALYHLSVVGVSNLLGLDLANPPSIKIFWDSFRYRAIDVQTNDAWYLMTEDQNPPYYGPILALHVGRWLSILFSLAALFLVFLTVRELLPQQPWLAVIATALLAFIPQFIFVSSALNEDALVAVLAALYFWLLVRVIKQSEKLWLYGVVGLALGLSVTAKYTTIILPLEVGLTLAILARQQGYNWSWWWRRMVIVGGSAILASSWWFGWNFWFLNEVKELGLVPGLLRPLFTGGTDVTLARLGNFFSGGQIGLTTLPENTRVGTFPEWIWTTFLSFWGVRIGDTIPLSPYVYGVIGLILAAALVGLWRLWRVDQASRKWLLLLSFHIALFIILPLIRFGLSRRLGQTAQGRHMLIPAAAAVVGLLVWGLATTIPPRWQRWLFPLLIAGLIGWTGMHLYQLNTFAPSLLPLRTLPQAAEWLPHRAGVKFGEAIELVSYELEPQPEQGQLRLNLAWRSLTHINENYLLELTVRDTRDQIVSHWLGFNGQGRLPTLAWEPGDSVFDRLALPLPNLPAGDYKVQVQWVGAAGPLPVSESGCKAAETQSCDSKFTLTLAEVSLNEPAMLPLPYSLSLTGSNASTQINFAVWQTNGMVEPSQNLKSKIQNQPYRYPATISIIASKPDIAEARLNLQLVDESGQAWSAERSEANIFTFVIGSRWPSGTYKLRMMLQEGDEVVGETTSEPLLTVENWWPRNFTIPDIASPNETNFANQLKFLGYKLPQNQVKAGEALPLTLYWQALPNKSPQADFIQFNHLVDSAGNLRGGYDRHPLEYYSTLFWAPGEVVVDGYTVPVAADAPPGQYYLDVGYYLIVGESAVNLPLVVDGQVTETTNVTIGPIEVIR